VRDLQRIFVGWLSLLFLAGGMGAQELYEAVRDEDSPSGIAYQRYYTRDGLDRRIAFYLSTDSDPSVELPLVVFILGSGAHSNFKQGGDRILDAHRTLREAALDRARVLAVERPGVAFLSQPDKNGTAVGASDEFLREHTADRWSEAVHAAIRATGSLSGIDRSRLLVVGHSEGARIAARVAALNPQVTHAAGWNGFATSRLRCMLNDRAWNSALGEIEDLNERTQAAAELWRRMLAEKDDYRQLFSGHSFRYWASFKGNTTFDFLESSSARIYLAQGTEDNECTLDGFELLFARLVEAGRDVTAVWVPGANHGFGFPDDPKRNGWREQMKKVLDWYLRPD